MWVGLARPVCVVPPHPMFHDRRGAAHAAVWIPSAVHRLSRALGHTCDVGKPLLGAALCGRREAAWGQRPAWPPAPPPCPQELIRKGIPHHFRAIVWQLLCSATDMPVKNQYSELLKMSSPCEKLIRRDIARTYPEHEFFKGQDSLGQEVLFNVMKVRPLPPSGRARRSTVHRPAVTGPGRACPDAHVPLQAYSLVDREVGYCQGSAFIVGLLLMQVGGRGQAHGRGQPVRALLPRGRQKQCSLHLVSQSQRLLLHPPMTSDRPQARPQWVDAEGLTAFLSIVPCRG